MQQRVFFVTSEVYPFSKTGGLGDVLGALPLAVRQHGVPCAVISPLYGRIRTSDYQIRLIISDLPVGYPWQPITADIYETDYCGVPLYFIDRSEYFDRRYYYNNHKGNYFDNAERFIFFCRAVIALMERLGEPPAFVHAHDWHTALLPAYIYFLRRSSPFWFGTGTMLTIHNLAFQGRFSSRLFESSGLPQEAWNLDGVEYYGDVNMLKGGIAYADVITTVSPGYAREILTQELGCGLEGILRRRGQNLYGILNGADYTVWDPAADPFLPCAYSPQDLSGKQNCKDSLIMELGLDPALADRPLLGFIGRLREQKGIDLLNAVLPELMNLDVGVIVLGEGGLEHEARVLQLMEDYPERLCAVIGYTEELAHRIQAACDIFLMPSRYEPCGLTQMYALRYGTPPVATAVGGLCDTIVPWPLPDATGFTFAGSTPGEFLGAVCAAVTLWNTDKGAWKDMMRRAMCQSFTWERASREYIALYRSFRPVLP